MLMIVSSYSVISHIVALNKQGTFPVRIKAMEEGSVVIKNSIIYNCKYTTTRLIVDWLVNYLRDSGSIV
jgi:hypothetical protein